SKPSVSRCGGRCSPRSQPDSYPLPIGELDIGFRRSPQPEQPAPEVRIVRRVGPPRLRRLLAGQRPRPERRSGALRGGTDQGLLPRRALPPGRVVGNARPLRWTVIELQADAGNPPPARA